MSSKEQKTSIILSGITGFLGSHLAKILLENGYTVVGLKRTTSPLQLLEPILSQITLYNLEEIDLSLPFLENKNITTVIHTATCYGRNGEDITQVFEANTLFPLKLLWAAVSAGVATFINADTSLAKSLNAYSLSKKQFVEWGKHFATRKKFTFFNARLEHFFGPGDSDTKFTTNIIKNCMNNVPELKLTEGKQKRDFIYIDDAVSAFLAILKNKSLYSEQFIEFDIGSGQTISIRDFVEIIHRMTGSHTHLNFGAVPYREAEVMFSQADISFLRELGWSPRYSLRQRIEQTVKSNL